MLEEEGEPKSDLEGWSAYLGTENLCMSSPFVSWTALHLHISLKSMTSLFQGFAIWVWSKCDKTF